MATETSPFHTSGPRRTTPQPSAALELLLQAWLYAHDVQLPVWEFAVEFEILQSLGLTRNEARWLMARGYAEHALEVTSPTDTTRKFGPPGVSLLGERSCFVLTTGGLQFARSLGAGCAPQPFTVSGSDYRLITDVGPSRPTIVPHWDCDLREIRYDGQLVKQFKLPSPNQEAILMTFEEEQWPPRIDDPLPHTASCDPKQRLHDTIRSLNRNQKNRLLRFKGDGTGEGVLWEVVQDTTDDEETE
jgi:hypothetical protein